MTARDTVTAVCLGHFTMLRQGDRVVESGFKKLPEPGPIRVGRDGVEGDKIGNKANHGGPEKAVLVYGGSYADELGGAVRSAGLRPRRAGRERDARRQHRGRRLRRRPLAGRGHACWR